VVRAEGKAPVLLVLPGPESARPFVFQLLQHGGAGGEVLCTSEGYKKTKAAEKAAHAAAKAGGDLKNYLFQKSADAKGEHHFWELREGKKHKSMLCRSAPAADRAQAEHSAAVASKAFAQATVTVK
jgi:uncharacterized protein YegP (UPF0339 family)